MPRAITARRKPLRARRSKAPSRASKPSARAAIISLALDMEEPLHDARALVHALRLIGHAMADFHGDEGLPIVTVASAASERLDALSTAWNGIIEASRK